MDKEPVTMVLVGAGNRGRGIFGQYALDMPHRAKFVAVAEPDDVKRHEFGDVHGIPPEHRFPHFEPLFAQHGKMAEAAIIATLEDERLAPAMAAMKVGCHILIEKPLGTRLDDVLRITDAAARYDKLFMVCHQLRYTPIYSAVKSLIDSGRFGHVICVQHSEQLHFSHMAHSFVRGFWNSSSLTPMILAKSCHDMDMLRWLIDSKPIKVSSFGSLMHFRAENAPIGAPERCLDGCPAEHDCPYSVRKLYIDEDTDPAYYRQMGVFQTRDELMALLATNRFGRCVYRHDNDVVDHQVVQILFENGVTADFMMSGHNAVERRMTKISLDRGEIEADIGKNIIRAHTFEPRSESVITPHVVGGTHHGGDRAIMDAFTEAIKSGETDPVLTSVKMSLDGHVTAFAAEESRRTEQVVDLAEFESRIRAFIGDSQQNAKYSRD